ncbi:gag-pol polyprotein [Trichonephila clavipes]|nr:gag-pol polyprotein [Trichonephila clavipes]
MAEPSKHTSRLFLLDRKSGQKFLIDSGSEICVIPPSPTMNKSPQSNFSLFAANNTKIPAYGMVRKELNLGLRRPFIWTFIIADVSSPIIGADFLKHFNLLIDLKKKRKIFKCSPKNSINLKYEVISVPQGSVRLVKKTQERKSSTCYLLITKEVTSSSPVPLKTRRLGERCTLNLSRAQTSSCWSGVVVKRGQLKYRPRQPLFKITRSSPKALV